MCVQTVCVRTIERAFMSVRVSMRVCSCLCMHIRVGNSARVHVCVCAREHMRRRVSLSLGNSEKVEKTTKIVKRPKPQFQIRGIDIA